MPRPFDPKVGKRILDAAQQLLRREGADLNMRALAREAKTTLPTIYNHFDNRDAILRALRLRFEQELSGYLVEAESIEAGTERYIDFAMHRAKKYEMWFAFRDPLRGSTPGRHHLYQAYSWARKKISERLGSSPNHTQLLLALWGLVHGTASLLVTEAVPRQLEAAMRVSCRLGVGALMQESTRMPDRISEARLNKPSQR